MRRQRTYKVLSRSRLDRHLAARMSWLDPRLPTSRLFSRFARPQRGLQMSHPGLEMRMLCRPCQHRAGYAEVIVQAWRTGIHQSARAMLSFQIGELIIGTPHLLPIGKSNLMI